jgi:hypothetical protein
MWVGLGRPSLPELLPATAEVPAPKSQDGVGSPDGPVHPGLFEALADDGPTAGLDYTRAHEEALLSELAVSHPLRIGLEVFGGLAQLVVGGLGLWS